MASAADSLASGLNLSKFGQATELKRRIWFTVGALIVFRLLSYVPLPGVDPTALTALANRTNGGVLDFFNNFSGGALKRASLIALGVMPYITASIVVQLATSLSPQLAAIKKEGESGRKRLNQYTRYGTVALTMIQAYFLARTLEAQAVAVDPGMLFRMSVVISLVGGTMFLMWLGEQITSRGIGNGISLIIMAGIVANMPTNIVNLLNSARSGQGNIGPAQVIGIVVAVAAIVLFICFMERAQRRILIQYPKRQTQRGVQSDRSHLPLKINTAGVIPPIFASSLLLLPLTITQFAGNNVSGTSWWGDVVITLNQYLQHGSPLYMTLYGAGIIFFSFFYTAVVFNPEETADNLKRYGGFIPGIRPGKNTETYFDYVLTRITVIGAAYLTIICLVPEYLVSALQIPFYLGGTSLLIVVNVTMDTVTQIQSHLLAHQYGDLIKKAKLKGGRLR
ncbi:MAG: preprotein translocase subunit SecY [Sphingomonas sp.]|uniref:preprotein translocase subunit SecY n=1 Tax=Sphingomonas sp. TaxID=28214 RepID=UPI001AD09F96|nr:preprotein translocase subunit SecY [Sphingomonas sp.]MBN8807004.1 preprotein translocase subunit SecY [Sphingomonas sp.]